MIAEEVLHWIIHLTQMAIVLAALPYLARTYKAVRSKFNLGLIFFASAMLIHIASFLVFFALHGSAVFHYAGEIGEIIALLIFLYLITR